MRRKQVVRSWMRMRQCLRIDCRPKRNLLATLHSTFAINRVHDHRRLRREVGYDEVGGYYQVLTPTAGPTPAVSNGGRWSSVGGCAERNDLMLELPHPGMHVVCARFSKIISGHPSASQPAILCAIRIHYHTLCAFAFGARRLFE